MNVRLWLAAASGLWAMVLLVLMRPEAWMWRVWAVAWTVLAIVAAIAVRLAVRSPHTRARPPWTAPIPALAALWAFTVIAVLAAILETRAGAVDRWFWPLAGGMIVVVATFMSSYDRSRQPISE